MIKKLFLCFLFLFICLNIFSKQSKKNVVRVDIIGKNANRSYFIKFLMGDWLWDYSNYFCNFEGRIALWSSVKFGIGGLIIVYIVEPLINLCIKRAGKTAINVFSLVLAVIFLIDLSFRPFLGSNFLGK